MYADVAKVVRCSERVNVNCHLTYSGIVGDNLIVGEGRAIDLSAQGVGISGNQAVEKGMRLTLCLAIPDGKTPLMIDEVRVVWVHGERFGVKSSLMHQRSRLRLDHFLLYKKLMMPDKTERVSLRVQL
jgi:hypothetical protein